MGLPYKQGEIDLSTADTNHAGNFNERFNKLLENDSFLKDVAEKGMIPVAGIYDLSASPDDESAHLSWTNPPDLTVEDAGGNTVTLAEFDTVEIRRGDTDYPDRGEGELVYEGSDESYTDTGLTNEETYYYSIWAITTEGVYSERETVSVEPVDYTMDWAHGVTDFEAIGATEEGDRIELSWENPNDAGFEGVHIRRKQGSYPEDIFDGVEVYDGADEAYTDTSLTEGETYYYTIWAYNEQNQYSAEGYEQTASAEVMQGPPGPAELAAGDTGAGYFGEVSANDLITGDDLTSALGITEGTGQNSNTEWLKFSFTPPGGAQKIIFVAKNTIRREVSWDEVYNAGAVYGTGEDISPGEQWMLDNDSNYTSGDRVPQDAEVVIDGITYRVRLMRGAADDPTDSYDDSDKGAIGPENEWNALMLPIHENAPDSWEYPEYVDSPTADWKSETPGGTGYTDEDLLTHHSFGDGSNSWCQETRDTDASTRVIRGRFGVSCVDGGASNFSTTDRAWRPLLEVKN